MIEDHTNANNLLQQIAAGKSIALRGDMDPKDQATYNRLAALNGEAFDRAYMRDMVQDHQQDIAEFKREAASGADPELKQFAATTLPTLERIFS
jgi:putative membrane protein